MTTFTRPDEPPIEASRNVLRVTLVSLSRDDVYYNMHTPLRGIADTGKDANQCDGTREERRDKRCTKYGTKGLEGRGSFRYIWHSLYSFPRRSNESLPVVRFAWVGNHCYSINQMLFRAGAVHSWTFQ